MQNWWAGVRLRCVTHVTEYVLRAEFETSILRSSGTREDDARKDICSVHNFILLRNESMAEPIVDGNVHSTIILIFSPHFFEHRRRSPVVIGSVNE